MANKTELKPAPSIEDEIEKLAVEIVGDVFPSMDANCAIRYVEQTKGRLRSLIPIVRREAMRECAEIARNEDTVCEWDKGYSKACKAIASAIEQRMEGTMSDDIERLYNAVAKCGECGKVLNTAENVPENKRGLVGMSACFFTCPERHHNTFSDLNLRVEVEWTESQ